MEVEYLKLSDQYASFLMAFGGVSITVLSIVLAFITKSDISITDKSVLLLIAALVVATISCFTGAHMMAETAASISYYKDGLGKLALNCQNCAYPSGERLFMLASINIFISVVLVIFALTLLPVVFLKEKAAEFRLISIFVFGFIIIAVLGWLSLSSFYRMSTRDSGRPIGVAIGGCFVWGLALLWKSRKCSLLNWVFIPIIVFTLLTLLRFAWTFERGGKVEVIEQWLLNFAVTSTCVSLSVAASKTLGIYFRLAIFF